MPDEHPSAVSGAFREPFPEQVAFFRGKLGNLVPTERWDDIEREAHDSAFMVAGATKADLLTDLGAATDRAITEGKSLEAFRKDFKAIVGKHGWTGWTGEGRLKGEAWRVRTIYSTNAYTSYAAGRLAQLREGNFPFWLYRHGGSLEPRLHHLAWDGTALPPDHEFWKTHYPPSDWGCSCYVVGARSARGVKRLGGDPDKQLPKDWKRRDPKTGAPVGIGRGWDYAPGSTVSNTISALAAKPRNWDYAVSKAFMGSLPPDRAEAFAEAYRSLPSTQDDARRFAKAIYEGRPPAADKPVRTLGPARATDAAEVKRLTGKDVDGFDYRVAQDSVRHVINEHTDPEVEAARDQRVVGPEDFGLLPSIVSSPDAITGPSVSKTGELLVHFSKLIGTERVTATFAIHERRRSMTLKTYFVKVMNGPALTP